MLQPVLEKLNERSIILASSSPRRHDILKKLGLKFQVMPPNFDESSLMQSSYSTPSDYAIDMAYQKLLTVSDHNQADLFIAADTIVTLNGDVLGKPVDEDSAKEMLRRMSGKLHVVHTGVVLLWENETPDAFAKTTHVKMTSLSEETIAAYVATGEPMDKAGAYGIQGLGGSLVEEIHGCFFNVAGLPLQALCSRIIQYYPKTGWQ